MIYAAIITIIWVVSAVVTFIIFVYKGIPFTFANVILALIPGINTVIVIKTILVNVLFNGIFKEMKDTLKIIFTKHKK